MGLNSVLSRGAFKKKEKENSHEKSNPGKKRPTDFSSPFFFSFFLTGSALCASAADITPHLGTGSISNRPSLLVSFVLLIYQ
jgi:hypothetical protein